MVRLGGGVRRSRKGELLAGAEPMTPDSLLNEGRRSWEAAYGRGRALRAMRFHQKNHLFCSWLALRGIAEQVANAATKGLSPSGTGARGVALPAAEFRAVEEALDRSLEAVGGVVEDLAGELAEEHSQMATIGATRAWVAVLLGQALEIIEDLEPARFSRKFGAIGAAESARLEAATAGAKEQIARARARLGKGGA